MQPIPQTTTDRRDVRDAFTLVELLVVIGTITVLIGLLLPALGRAREASRTVACASNMHQVGVAVAMFENAHHGDLPRPPLINAPMDDDAVYWQTNRLNDIGVSGLGRYLQMTMTRKDIMVCPTDSEALGREEKGKSGFTYTFNENMNGTTGPATVRKATQVRAPSAKILMIEENGPSINDGSVTLWARTGQWANVGMLGLRHDRINRPQYPDTASATRGIVNRNGKANALFVDGHVAYLTRAEAHTKRAALPDATLFPNDAEGGPA